jgi:dihydrofolate synthase/folylpolyglutamate synthase
MLADKDIAGVLGALSGIVDLWFVGSLPPPRGAMAEELAGILRGLGLAVRESKTVTAAYQETLAEAVAGDRIIVFGSFYTVAEVLAERV